MTDLQTIHDYLRMYAPELGQRILETYPPLHRPGDGCPPYPSSSLRRKSNVCSKPATFARRAAAATTPSFFYLPVSVSAPGRWLLSSSMTSTGEPAKSSFAARGCFTTGCPCLRMWRGINVLPAPRSSGPPNAPGIHLHEGATPWLCRPLGKFFTELCGVSPSRGCLLHRRRPRPRVPTKI